MADLYQDNGQNRRMADRRPADPYAEAARRDTSQDFLFEDQDTWNQVLPHSQNHRQAYAPHPTSRPAVRAEGRGQAVQNGEWSPYAYVIIIVVCFVLMSIIAVMMMPQMAGYFWKDFPNYAFVNGEVVRYDEETNDLYEQYRSYMYRDVIYPGVLVDGISVGDMTIEEARAALTGTSPQLQSNTTPYSVTVSIGDRNWQIDQTNVPAARNLGNVLEKAYAIGRTNNSDIQITKQTPFRQRVDRALELRNTPVNLATEVTYDASAVRNVVDEITAYVTRDPINAQILTFDYKSRTFTFSDHQSGVIMDSDLLYNRIIAALDQEQIGAIVTTNLTLIPPDITKDDLASNFNLIAAYTTETTRDTNRNNNIALACQAINGTALMPGETFSFNEATGQRTYEKGYLEAGAIASGQSIEEVGGGICQVSSTLFNAVARADLEIVERSAHAWPSTYVERGEDATVNWPNLDFKFKNSSQAPIFIITYYNDRKMSAEIWGMALEDGMSIDLESHVVKTINPPQEIKYVQNPELPYGSSQTTVKARTGYVVDTYKVWYQNGQEIRREFFYTSTYKAYQQVVEYN
ncbi:MAG: hypothetical protein E7320_07560 [Clostridiales bacterium]|nr:hypothetical protein [Clostridiales bacterium]